jgi:hypothetical protein
VGDMGRGREKENNGEVNNIKVHMFMYEDDIMNPIKN